MIDLWIWLLPITALAADALFGDPPGWPHPVRGIGWLAGRVEPPLRRLADRTPLPHATALRLAGISGVLLVAGISGLLAYAACITPLAGVVAALYLSYAALALGALRHECAGVARSLEAGNLDDARRRLAWLVSRDTGHLDAPGVYRALVETLSENLNDGFIAPFFYLILGLALAPAGQTPALALALLWLYKAISTLDSLWAYRTPRWEDFGKAAARADDVLAWVPARLTALALLLAGSGLRARSVETGSTFAQTWAGVRNDATLSESPNAGWPMAAAAWTLGLRLGGPAHYFGKPKDKPWFGPETSTECSWSPKRYAEIDRLALYGALLAAAGLLAAGLLLRTLLN